MKEKFFSKKKILILVIILIVIITSLIMGTYLYKEKLKKEQIELENRIRLNRKITVEVYDSITVKDVFAAEPIIITYEDKVDTSKVGRRKINIKYKDEKRSYKSSVFIDVVDTTPPVIFSKNSYKLYKGKNLDFVNYILCGDNYDNNPTRKIIGEYNNQKVGSYKVKYYAEDSSGNHSEKEFTIKVVNEPVSNDDDNYYQEKLTKFSDIIKTYKKDNNEIGIDVSKWQGNIDFEKVKNAGAEFVVMRIGIQNGVNGELSLDKYFKSNIEKATKAGLKVGVYLYTYARSKEDAINQAKWVIDNLGNYNIELGIAYDWESWTKFNELNLSFYSFSEVAETFLNYVESKGYNSMLYGSKYYLENVWLKTKHNVWLAHYTTQTDYEGEYIMWQLMSTGSISGIDGAVDIDILYKDNKSH